MYIVCYKGRNERIGEIIYLDLTDEESVRFADLLNPVLEKADELLDGLREEPLGTSVNSGIDSGKMRWASPCQKRRYWQMLRKHRMGASGCPAFSKTEGRRMTLDHCRNERY